MLALFASFAALLRKQRGNPGALEPLRERITQTESSSVSELTTFIAKLWRDRDAVLAPLTLPYNHGQTEGQITKLKLLKRIMYGRAKFNLLRGRVFYIDH